MDWNKTTYRVSRIPKRFHKDDLSNGLASLLGLRDATEVKIHSLALDIPSQGQPYSQTATVSFHVRPRLLESNLQAWDFDIPSNQHGVVRIFIDVIFDGFTPLAQPQGGVTEIIEYDKNLFPSRQKTVIM